MESTDQERRGDSDAMEKGVTCNNYVCKSFDSEQEVEEFLDSLSATGALFNVVGFQVIQEIDDGLIYSLLIEVWLEGLVKGKRDAIAECQSQS